MKADLCIDQFQRKASDQMVRFSLRRSFCTAGAPAFAKVHEVSPRDGLQNEPVVVPTDIKLDILQKLVESNPASIEVGCHRRLAVSLMRPAATSLTQTLP